MTNELKQTRKRGETIVSIIFAVAIFGIMILAIAGFQIDVFKFAKQSSEQSDITQQLTLFLREFAKELRSAQQSSTGSFLIETANDSQIVFFSDLHSDGLMERVRYSVTNQTLEKGVVVPTGNPLSYNLGNEQVHSIIPNIANTGPVFSYFDAGYNGVTVVTPMLQPVNVQDIKVVQIHLSIDPKTPNLPFVGVTTTVTIRNLKTN